VNSRPLHIPGTRKQESANVGAGREDDEGEELRRRSRSGTAVKKLLHGTAGSRKATKEAARMDSEVANEDSEGLEEHRAVIGAEEAARKAAREVAAEEEEAEAAEQAAAKAARKSAEAEIDEAGEAEAMRAHRDCQFEE
jgi:hypothetical protein